MLDAQAAAGVLDPVAGGLEVEGDAALLELLGQLLGGVGVLLRDQLREHLDDRHLGAEAAEDACELAADDPAAEDDQAWWDFVLREQARGVDAARGVEAVDRRAEWVRAGGDDRLLEGDVVRALAFD